MSLVKHITTADELTSGPGLTVIDFSASWCGPCKAIGPHFDALSKEYPNVNFVKVDVDEVPEIAEMFSVTSLPTFIFLSDNQVRQQIQGANLPLLKSTLANLTSF